MPAPGRDPFLSEILVAEIGDRVGVAARGSVLAQLGADVVLTERPNQADTGKWRNRAVTGAGKLSIQAAPSAAAVERLLDTADVILLASDLSSAPRRDWHPHQIVCDITAFGASSPLSGR